MGKGKVIIDIVRARRGGWRLPAPPVAHYQKDLALIRNKDLSRTQTLKSVGDMMSKRSIVRESKKKVLLLPRDMKQYLEECFTEFIPDKVLKEKILDQYPPPELTKSMELDDYVAEFLVG